jgi:hypothetical protein
MGRGLDSNQLLPNKRMDLSIALVLEEVVCS